MENSMEVPYKMKNRITLSSDNSTSGYTPKNLKQGLKEIFIYPYL